MFWRDALDIAAQMASDTDRDPSCSYPRCWIEEAVPANDRGDYYWADVTIVWPDGFCDPS